MWRKLLQGKIHRATVTAADLAYEGSITVDRALMQAAGMIANEAVDVYNVTNGHRFQTYAIPAPPGSGTIQVNGAAAHLAGAGDLVIIAAYGYFNAEEAAAHMPRIVRVDAHNRAVPHATAVPATAASRPGAA